MTTPYKYKGGILGSLSRVDVRAPDNLSSFDSLGRPLGNVLNFGKEGKPGAIAAKKDLHDKAFSIQDLENILRKRIIGQTARDAISKAYVAKAFRRAGGDSGKALSFATVQQCFAQWGIHPSDTLMQRAFNKWDLDDSGDIDFQEFYAVVMGDDFDLKHKSVYNRFTDEPCPHSSPLAQLSFEQSKIGRQALRRDSINTHVRKMQSSGCMVTQQMHVAELIDLIRHKIFLLSNSNCAGRTAKIYKLLDSPAHGLSRRFLKKKLTLWGIHVTDPQLEAIFGQIGVPDMRGRVSFHDFMQYLGADSQTEAQEHPLGESAAFHEQRERLEEYERKSHAEKIAKQRSQARPSSAPPSGRSANGSGAKEYWESAVAAAAASRSTSKRSLNHSEGAREQHPIYKLRARPHTRTTSGISAGVEAKVRRRQAQKQRVVDDLHRTKEKFLRRQPQAQAQAQAAALSASLASSSLSSSSPSSSTSSPSPSRARSSPYQNQHRTRTDLSPAKLDSQFLHRLVQNARHAIARERSQARGSSGGGGWVSVEGLLSYWQDIGLSKLHLSSKAFARIVRTHCAQPMAMPVHVINAAIVEYRLHDTPTVTDSNNDGEEEAGGGRVDYGAPLDTKRLFRDLRYMVEAMVADEAATARAAKGRGATTEEADWRATAKSRARARSPSPSDGHEYSERELQQIRASGFRPKPGQDEIRSADRYLHHHQLRHQRQRSDRADMNLPLEPVYNRVGTVDRGTFAHTRASGRHTGDDAGSAIPSSDHDFSVTFSTSPTSTYMSPTASPASPVSVSPEANRVIDAKTIAMYNPTRKSRARTSAPVSTSTAATAAALYQTGTLGANGQANAYGPGCDHAGFATRAHAVSHAVGHPKNHLYMRPKDRNARTQRSRKEQAHRHQRRLLLQSKMR